MRKVDIHQHINSRGDIRPDEINAFIANASQSLGAGSIIGIVDFHGLVAERKCEQSFEIMKKNHDAEVFCDSAAYLPRQDLWVLRGLESETSAGHILSVGLKLGTYIESSRDLPLVDALAQACIRRASTILDHFLGFEGAGPYVDKHRGCLEEGLVGAIETHNRLAFGIPTKTTLFPNRAAKKWYAKNVRHDPSIRVGEIYGADGHNPQSVGTVYTLLPLNIMPDNPSFPEYFDNVLRANKMARGKTSTSLPAFVQHGFAVIGGYEGMKNGLSRLILGKRSGKKI